MARWSKIVLVNVAILVAGLAVMEGGSWAVLKLYYGAFFSAKDATTGEELQLNSEFSIYSSKELEANRTEWVTKGGHTFVPYLMFVNTPFRSTHLNILPDWRRSNGVGREVDRNACGLRIWMLGSSSLTALEVHDDQTLPAVLERELNRRLKETVGSDEPELVCVENYGQVAYITAQDLNLLNAYISKYSPPNIIVLFNGWNDSLV